ncbi:helix-turn-helix domain-containing protein [Nonomuraea sp. NPDC050404]|uniref:helix-turn-helix domain-containing protein n=1 Tax=Nonomuraea sp. NPDC050404 TaxID=3155783 RepID=UPI0033D6C8A9
MKTLRLHFGQQDLTRVRLASGYHAMWEIVLSIHQLAFPAQHVPFFATWRRSSISMVERTGLEATVRQLAELMPAAAYFPDFLTPPSHPSGLGSSLDIVLATPRARLRAEIQILAATYRQPPSWLATLAGGQASVLAQLGNAIRRYHAVAIAQYDEELSAAVEADLAQRRQMLATNGVEALLRGLHPSTRWEPPILRVDYPVEADIHLDGRGLLLIPTFFGIHKPIALADRALLPVLAYPINRAQLWEPQLREERTRQRLHALSDLLGPVRAAVLLAIDDGLSTTALAAALSTSSSSASRHATALRRAGLIHTSRQGQRVLHTRSPLGDALVKGSAF